MTKKDAISILENMAVDMVGALADMRKKNPMRGILEQRIDAINVAQRALDPSYKSNRNVMLTISDLKNMNGQKIYLENEDGAFYGLVEVIKDAVSIVNGSGNGVPVDFLEKYKYKFYREKIDD